MNKKQKQFDDLYNQGTILLEKRELQEALIFFEKAYKIDNTDFELLTNLGVTHLQLKQYQEGLTYLEEALKYNAHDSITLFNKAKILSILGKFSEAIKTLEILFQYNPSFSQARPFLMQIRRHQKVFDQLNLKRGKIPQEALNMFKEGYILLNRKKLSEAHEKLSSAIQIYPEFAEAYLYLGIVSKMLGSINLDYYNKALQYDPNLILAWIHKGMVYDSQKKFKEAIDCYNKAIAINPSDSASWNNKGLALDSLEQYDKAIECYNKSIELNPDFEGAWYNRATSYKEKGHIEQALADYKKTLELNPRNINAQEQIDSLRHFSSAGLDGTIRSWHDARDYCPRCGKKSYTNTGICQYCGTTMYKEDIEKLLERAIEAENLGDFDQALMLFVQINDKQPALAPAWYYRGKAHCALGEFKNALMCFGKAQQLGFKAFQIMMYGLMAKNNMTKFEPPNLDPQYLKDKEMPRMPIFFANEKDWTANGAALQMLGQYEDAYKCYQEALERNPNYSLAKKNQEIIQKLTQK